MERNTYMSLKVINSLVTYFISAIWLINGLFCKVLNFEPRHQQIVSRILGGEYASELTLLIGLSELVMVVWVLSRFKSRLNAIFQITIVLVMNVIEFFFASDILLWGKFNIVYACLFIALVYYNEFVLIKKINKDVVS
ncbi:DoxX-like family protein [Tenacibaculum ovolyticum]|uniref:DoxX-like family protein n=1 Tax=Tenacibaculum ovolyticum TaxID=104270 RepID=UPI0007EDBBF4|nr:DoxX-like family protein [Tenacibaculum ovolyticum]